MVQLLLPCLALVALALLLGAATYESVVMAPNYEHDIPTSIDAARAFLKRTTPAHYFRLLSPVTQLFMLSALIACWSLPAARRPLLVALGILVLLDLITFRYHYPRLAIMFRSTDPVAAETLRKAAREWGHGNLWRIMLLLVAFGATLRALIIVAEGTR
jgi:hypothetical protein